MSEPRSNERGNSRLKFVFVMAIIACVAYAGYMYIPVAYNAYLFKDLMQHNVDIAVGQGYPPSWVGDQLTKSLGEYDIPANAQISPAAKDNRIEVRVQFTKPIEFPGFTYEYEFDHTARSTVFLSIR